MDIKITQAQLDLFKSGLVTSSFEMLDIDQDKTITNADLEKATDANLKRDIKAILEAFDEDAEMKTFSLDEINQIINENKNKTNTATSNSVLVDNIKAIEEIDINNIQGYTNVDTSNLTSLTENELTILQEKIVSNLIALNAELIRLQTQETDIQNDIKAKEAAKEELETQQKAKQVELNIANNELEIEIENLNLIQTEYIQYKEELDKINNAILIEQKLEEQLYEKTMKELSDEAIANYDPAIHGDDFEKYFAEQLEKANYPLFSNVEKLNSLANKLGVKNAEKLTEIATQSRIVWGKQQVVSNINNELNIITTNMQNIANEIYSIQEKQLKPVQNNIATVQNAIGTQNTIKTNVDNQITDLMAITKGKDVLALIPQAEKDLAIANNVDLTKCIIAKGKSDKKWHIYLKENNNKYSSLARLYGNKNKNPRGSDLVSVGNGYLHNLKSSTQGTLGAEETYTFSEINEDLTEGKATSDYNTYQTYSPLSFDINGDGIKTSQKTVIFDIDGDGKKDIINDSADYVLAFDKDGDGIAGENGSELFGNNTDLDGDGKTDGYKDGFEALKALAQKEGLISKNDTALDEKDIAHLSEKYGLVMKNGYNGEAQSLSELGVTQINLAKTDKTNLVKNFDGQQNDIMTQEGATFVVNGQTRNYADIWHSKKDIPQTNNTSNNITFNIDLKGAHIVQGKVDYEKIKQNVIDDIGVPQEILDEIVEYKEDEKE